jgi:hypothetical protein
LRVSFSQSDKLHFIGDNTQCNPQGTAKAHNRIVTMQHMCNS